MARVFLQHFVLFCFFFKIARNKSSWVVVMISKQSSNFSKKIGNKNIHKIVPVGRRRRRGGGSVERGR